MSPGNEARAHDTLAGAQAPHPGSLSIDHIAHFVPDVDAASTAIAQLGFELTPFSAQSHRLDPAGPLEPAGTGNRCVMLERGYLELLTPIAHTPLADQLRAAIRRYVGVHLIAFGTASPEMDYARLAEGDFGPMPPVALERPIATERGEDLARFTVVRVPPGRMAEGRIQFCQHHTPQLVWQRRWVEHHNAIVGLAAVFLCVADPAEAAQRYSRYTGLSAAKVNGAWLIETARGALMLVDAATLLRGFALTAPALPWIAGYALQSKDVSATRAYLSGAGFDVSMLPGDRLLVRLPAALGGILVVEAAGSSALRFE